jgi:ribosome-associated translation inhibitor RaiA
MSEVMAISLNVTCRDMALTPAIERFLQGWADKLEAVSPRASRCEVVIERPHQHQHQGQRFRVRVSLAAPGPDIVVSRDPALDASHEDVYVAIRDAFRAARRQLEARGRRQRRDSKAGAPSRL